MRELFKINISSARQGHMATILVYLIESGPRNTIALQKRGNLPLGEDSSTS